MNFKPAENKISNNFCNGLDLFLNNASRSPIPLSHKKIIEEYLVTWSHANHDPYYFNFTHADKLKQQIGLFVNSDANQIAIGTNVADGFSKLLHGLDWDKTDEIILVDDDYPSVTLPFQTKTPPTIRWVKPINGITSVESIQKILTPNVRAIALSWINYTTGQVNHISDISEFCKKNNILLFVDATQALGVLPIDLSTIQIDYFTASLYKWCFCPQGIAISIFSSTLLNKLTPIGSGVFSQHDRQLRHFPNEPSSSARKFEYGNLNILGIMLAHETFRWFNDIGINLIHTTLKRLAQGILEMLVLKSYRFPVRYSVQHASSILSFIHPDADTFMNQLQNHGGNATYRHGMVRLSPGIYQNDTTIIKLRDIL